MTQTADHMQQYLDHFARFEKSLNGQTDAAVHALRRDAIARFADLGLPTTRDEAWRFTNLAPIARTDFAPAAPCKLTTAALTPFLFPRLDCIQLVFVNGHYVDELSTQGALPAGVKVANLAAVLESDADLVAAYLGRRSAADGQAFAALNTAFIRDGAFIYLPRDAVLEQTVHLLFLSSTGDAPTVSHPRNLIVAEANSQATLVESYAGDDGQVYLTNALTEVVVGEGAALEHYKIQRESRTAFHLANMQVYSKCAANFTSTSTSLGGRLARHDIHAQLAGEGAERESLDPARIAVSGDSVGGTLVVSTCLMARDKGGPAIKFQMPLYGLYDMGDGADFPSRKQLDTGEYFVSEDTVRAMRRDYLTDPEADVNDPLASPIKAKDFSGLPPASVVTRTKPTPTDWRPRASPWNSNASWAPSTDSFCLTACWTLARKARKKRRKNCAPG